MKNKPEYMRNAIVLALILVLLVLGSLLWIRATAGKTDSNSIQANIYQNGKLIHSIALNEVSYTYAFTVTGTDNCYNEIEVRPGSIGIISADCPDKLCVHQGFMDSSLLPITCLPNHLVIQITEGTAYGDAYDADIVTY